MRELHAHYLRPIGGMPPATLSALHIVAPQVNLNGTSRAALTQQHDDILKAAAALAEALRAAYPHGRDSQTVANPSQHLAQREGLNLRWQHMVATIVDEVTVSANSVFEQGARRSRAA